LSCESGGTGDVEALDSDIDVLEALGYEIKFREVDP